MEDLSPKLLEQLRAHFLETLEKNARAAGLLQQIKAGAAGYAEAGEYAYEVGAALSETFRVGLSSDILPDGRMYQNIAEKVVAPLLGDDYTLVSKAAAQVQQTLNQAAGLGLKAQAAALDTERVQGIIHKVANSPSYDDVAWVLDEPVKPFSQSVVDATLQKTQSFKAKPDYARESFERQKRNVANGAAAWKVSTTTPMSQMMSIVGTSAVDVL